ncbi:hypothetical protein RAD15_05010 [Bradyrhizobium sp. 14AA]
MSRRTRAKTIEGQFVALQIEMINSPAWKTLSLSARRVIDRICIELANHGGKDNGKLPVTIDQFVEHGMDRHAVAPAIREVCALGFVEKTKQGRVSAGGFNEASEFRLTFTYTDAKCPPTHEWRRFPDLFAAQQVAQAARLPVAKPKKPRARPVTKPDPNRLMSLSEAIAADAPSIASGNAWSIRKNRKPVGVFPSSSGGNPHWKPKSPVGETPTTVLVGKTHTTSISPVPRAAITSASS